MRPHRLSLESMATASLAEIPILFVLPRHTKSRTITGTGVRSQQL